MGGELERLCKVVWVLGQIAIDGESQLGIGIKGLEIFWASFWDAEFHLDPELAWLISGSIGYIHHVDLHIWVSVRPEVRGGEGCGRAEFSSKIFLDGHQIHRVVADVGDITFTEILGCSGSYNNSG